MNVSTQNKGKRIVYRIRKQLQDVDIDNDFSKILEDVQAPKDEKQIGIIEVNKIRQELKEALSTAIKFGEQTGLLKYLKPNDFENLRKNVLSMLMSMEENNSDSDEKHSRYGEEIVAGKIQKIFFEELHPEPPVPQGIPRLNVTDIREEDKSEYEYLNLKSGDRLPSPHSILKVIASRPREIEKVNVGVQFEPVITKECQVQTSDIEEEHKKTPRILEDSESEGEIAEHLLTTNDNVICVRSNGEIKALGIQDSEVQTSFRTPRVLEEDDLVLSKSSSFLNVRDRTISTSSSSGKERVYRDSFQRSRPHTSSSDADDESHSL